MKATEALERIRQKGVPTLVQLHGEEPYFINLVLSGIRSFLMSRTSNVVWRDVGKPKGISLWQDLRQRDLRLPTRVLVFRDLSSKVDFKPLVSYLEVPMKNTYVVVQGKELSKILERKGLLVDCSPLNERKGEVEQWLMEQGKELGVKITEAVARFLVSIYGSDLSFMRNELEKLVIMFEGQELQVGNIEPYLTVSSKGLSIFKTYNAWAKKDRRALLRLISDAEKEGEQQGLIGMWFSFVERFLSVMAVKGADIQDVAKTLGKSPFLIRMDQKNAKNFSTLVLWWVAYYLAEADKALKIGRSCSRMLVKVVDFLCT
jgi:DNA polymerase III delta subunit